MRAVIELQFIPRLAVKLAKQWARVQWLSVLLIALDGSNQCVGFRLVIQIITRPPDFQRGLIRGNGAFAQRLFQQLGCEQLERLQKQRQVRREAIHRLIKQQSQVPAVARQ